MKRYVWFLIFICCIALSFYSFSFAQANTEAGPGQNIEKAGVVKEEPPPFTETDKIEDYLKRHPEDKETKKVYEEWIKATKVKTGGVAEGPGTVGGPSLGPQGPEGQPGWQWIPSEILPPEETEETAEGLSTRFELIWEPVHWQEYSGKSFKSGSEGLAGSQIGAGEKK